MGKMSLVSFAGTLALALGALGLGLTHAPAAQADPVPLQASCGDGRCQPPEDCHSCSADCGGCCGNHRCESPEDCHSCSADCGSCCGNHRCEPPEDGSSCPADCG